MNSSSPIYIPGNFSSLARLEELSLQDQSLFLLKRITLLFPRGKTFALDTLHGHSSLGMSDPDQLVPGLSISECGRAFWVLRDKPWDEIVRKGYVTKASRQPYWYQLRYEITAEGWAVADSLEFRDEITAEGWAIELDDDERDTEWYRAFMLKAERSRY